MIKFCSFCFIFSVNSYPPAEDVTSRPSSPSGDQKENYVLGRLCNFVQCVPSYLSVVGDHAPAEPSTTPALRKVSQERDVFTDDDHKLLDAKIEKTYSLYRTHNEEPDFPLLLFSIAGTDNRLITFSMDEAEKLLRQEPSIATILRNAWQAGSFKEVRQLGAFAVSCISSFELLDSTVHRNSLARRSRCLS